MNNRHLLAMLTACATSTPQRTRVAYVASSPAPAAATAADTGANDQHSAVSVLRPSLRTARERAVS